MRTSGLVLDLYDDATGDVIRSVYPTRQDIPEMVKSAHVLSHEERHRLPDDCFALVLLNGGDRLRKFACTDEGNTALSVQYFLKTAHKLPEEAQQTAAKNLLQACDWYGLEAPADLQKFAGIQAALTALTAVPVVKGTHDEMKSRMGAVRAYEGAGQIMTPAQMQALGKTAEVSGTKDMPFQGSSEMPSKKTVIKTSADHGDMGRLVSSKHDGESYGPIEGAVDDYTKGTQAQRLSQSKALHPHVNVVGKTAPKKETEKKASLYALKDKYPLDDYAQVKAAAAYFDKYGRRFVASDRHEYCVNLVKRASELSIPVSEIVQHYGATSFGPEEQLKMAFATRRSALGESEWQPVLDGLEQVVLGASGETKTASEQTALDAEFAVTLLEEFDKVASLYHHYDSAVPDPYYSIYGHEKVAEWSEVIGNDMVTERDLDRLARVGFRALRHNYGEDFMVEFRKDPVGVFKSMPRDQRKLIIRMAVENSAPGIELTA